MHKIHVGFVNELTLGIKMLARRHLHPLFTKKKRSRSLHIGGETRFVGLILLLGRMWRKNDLEVAL